MRYTTHFHQGSQETSITQVYSVAACIIITKPIKQDTSFEAAGESTEQSTSQYINVRQQLKAFQKVQSYFSCSQFRFVCSLLSCLFVYHSRSFHLYLLPVDFCCLHGRDSSSIIFLWGPGFKKNECFQ